MSTALQEPEIEETPNYLNAEYGWKSWLFTTDHKRIAVLYLISISVMFALGGVFAGLIRTELLTPKATCSIPTPTTRSSPCTAW